jgi:inorganic phosphate transporter, PiT family
VTELLMPAVVAVFAFANGVNDGGALVASGSVFGGSRVGAPVLVLVVAVLVAPAVITTAVARTLAEDLVAAGTRIGPVAIIVAVTVTLAVVWGLTSRGVPTSLTLAFVGALTGAGAGAGLGLETATIVRVLSLAALAPFAAALLAAGIGAAARLVQLGATPGTALRRVHRISFSGQCLAYGINDGQKMLAVGALLLGLDVTIAARSWLPLGLIGVSFAVGTLVGIRRVGGTVGGELVPMRPLRAVITEVSSATAVIGTGLAGAPVSMTQSIVGGLVGTGVTAGTGRVRWSAVTRVGVAWVVTLPVAFALAWAAARAGTVR